MSETDIIQALRRWRDVLGGDYVLDRPEAIAEYTSSVCGGIRRSPCVLRPKCTDEVRLIVEVANQCMVPLYPFSIGCNWGMGSRLPVENDCSLVDLSRMNRIIEVSVEQQYALIEPGVTQRQLYEYLNAHNLPLLFNVTGSSGGTSIIGNSLDRGVGYFASRADSLSGLEVVLGNGKIVRTGFRHYQQAETTGVYRHGVGPELDGIFSQSNYGIVTSAYFELMPRPKSHMAAIVKIDSDLKLAALIDALTELRRDEVIRTVAHIGNKARSEITLAPLVWEQLRKVDSENQSELAETARDMLAREGFGPWSAVIGILGNKAQIAQARRAIRRKLRGIAKTMFLTDGLVDFARAALARTNNIKWFRDKGIMLEAIMPLYEITKGIPTDAPLKSVYWPAGDIASIDMLNPDQSKSGMLYCLPIIPNDGDTIYRVMSRTQDHFRRYGFDTYITVNLMDARAAECVISLGCVRDDRERMQAARECIQEMEREYVREGYIPYRLGIDSMGCVLSAEDDFWQTARDLKKVLDPNNIIAPGKYNLI